MDDFQNNRQMQNNQFQRYDRANLNMDNRIQPKQMYDHDDLDLIGDEFINQQNEKSNSNNFYHNNLSCEVVKTDLIGQQNRFLNQAFQKIITQENINAIMQIQRSIQDTREGYEDSFLKTLNSLYSKIQSELLEEVNKYNMNKIYSSFSLLFQFDCEYKKLLWKLSKQIQELINYDTKRLQLDMFVYFIKGPSDKESRLFPQKWVYCNKYLLLKEIADLENKMKLQKSNFGKSPLNDYLIDIDQKECQDFPQPKIKVLEYTQIYLFHDIKNSLDLQMMKFNNEQKQILSSLIKEFWKALQEENKNQQNQIRVLLLYKQIQILYKSTILDPLNAFQLELLSQISEKIDKLSQQIQEAPDQLELGLIQDILIKFINEQYIEQQTKDYISKIKNILEGRKKNKIKGKVIDENILKLPDFIINLIPQNLLSIFQEIMTEQTVKFLKIFFQQNPRLNQINDSIQQKQLALIMCQQISQKIYPLDFDQRKFSEEQNYIKQQQILNQKPIPSLQISSPSNNQVQIRNYEFRSYQNPFKNNNHIHNNQQFQQNIQNDEQTTETKNNQIKIQNQQEQFNLPNNQNNNNIEERKEVGKRFQADGQDYQYDSQNYEQQHQVNSDLDVHQQRKLVLMRNQELTSQENNALMSDSIIGGLQQLENFGREQIEQLVQLINNECRLERHTYEILQNLNQTIQFNHYHHVVVIQQKFEFLIFHLPYLKRVILLRHNEIKQDTKIQCDLIQSINNYSQNIDQFNQLIISKQNFVFLFELLKFQIQPNAPLCHSPLAYFLFWFVVENSNYLHFTFQNNDDMPIQESIKFYLQYFTKQLSFYYQCNRLYNLFALGGKDIKIRRDNTPISFNDDNIMYLFKDNQTFFGYYSKQTFSQIYLNDLQNNQVIDSKIFSIRPPKQKYQYYFQYENDIEKIEITRLFQHSNMVIFQLLLSHCPLPMPNDNSNIKIQYFGKSMRENFMKKNFQITDEQAFNVNLALNPEYSLTKTFPHVQTQINYETNLLKDQQNKFFYEIVIIPPSKQLKKDQSFQQTIEQIEKQRLTSDNKTYYLVEDPSNKCKIIFNYSKLNRNEISSLLFIVNESYQKESVLNKLFQKYIIKQSSCYVLYITSKKNWQITMLKECINLTIKLIEINQLNEPLFSLILRDILMQDFQFFSIFQK